MYTHTKISPEFSRRGQIIAERAAHTIIGNEFASAYRMKDMAARNKTLDAMFNELRSRGFYIETTYDAAHGRVYAVIIFRLSIDKDDKLRTLENGGARRQAFDFVTAPESTFYTSPEA